MTTTRPKLAAEPRTVTGKHVARMRREGRLPAVVFGNGLASSNVSVDTHEFDRLRHGLGANALVDLVLPHAKPLPVLIHSVGGHRVTHKALHVDFYVVRMTEEMTVDVQVVGIGESDAVNTHGGTLLHVTETVKVRALPDHLPNVIHFPLERLATFEDVIHVRDLEIPKDAVLLTDGDEIVAKVAPPRVEEEAPAAPVSTLAEGEAAPAEAAAPAEGSKES